MKIISIQVIQVKAKYGLIAYCSFVLYESIYCSLIGIYTRTHSVYRFVYPTKIINQTNLNIFHTINSKIGKLIEQEVSKIVEKII